MIDTPFATHSRSASGPLTRAADVSPDDETDLPFRTRALLVGVGGDIAAVMADGDTVTLPALRAGVIYPVCVDRVLATGTSAESVVALA